MKEANKTLLAFLIFLVGIIVFLVYYIRNKKKVDYEVNEKVNEEAIQAGKDYVKNGLQDIKDIWNGKKNYFG